ncbi:phosphoribosyltransferase-like protein [Flagellimonas sp.]|uniref:phosphoribosyltransferase-like protein n=1 Tax=Flagellimonas sp. TaxID=2058762 RepID=UPI003BA9B446
MGSFSIPDNAEIYIHTVRDRCMDLVRFHIWDGLGQIDIKTWLKNFNGIEERYFAACILDYMNFRSEKQTQALAHQIFTRPLLNLLKEKGMDLKGHRDLIELMRSRGNPKIRLVKVGSRHDRPSKSSDIILRLFRRGYLGFNDNLFISPEEVDREKASGIECFIFVDDFLGTGDQFMGMVKEYGLQLVFNNVIAVYAPLVAHEKGVAKLTSECTNLDIVCGEYLNDDSSIFNTAFKDNLNSAAIAQSFYKDLLVKYGFNFSDDNLFGYGNLALVYGFSHAVPDSSLQIIWDDQNNWTPLIKK